MPVAYNENIAEYRDHLGVLERTQSFFELHLSVGLRFALLALAVLALFAALSDITKWYLKPPVAARGKSSRHSMLVYYINRFVLACAVLSMAPAAFYRLGRSNIDPDFAYALQLTSTALLIIYFLSDELIRLLDKSVPLRQALWRCLPFAAGALLLLFVGVNVNVWN